MPDTDEAAFRAAIAATPDDLAPRRAFADWLDEQGRAEEADYFRSWTAHVGRLEAKLDAAKVDIRQLEERLGEVDCGC